MNIIKNQQVIFNTPTYIMDRSILDISKKVDSEQITIIYGIRRSGKSTFLKQISKTLNRPYVYINFDDILFMDFTNDNFKDIEKIVFELFKTKDVVYLLDEVQEVPTWEKWVNNLQFNNIKVFVTGSNSKLLSSEYSDRLTGRNNIVQMFTFSFKEYLTFYNLSTEYNNSEEISNLINFFTEYLSKGGFPLVLKEDISVSKNLFNDILVRDILPKVPKNKKLMCEKMLVYLYGTIGKPYSYTSLTELSGIKSPTTIRKYIESFEDAFLIYRIYPFNYSYKKQLNKSPKVYSLDNSFLTTVSFNFTSNLGQKLENYILLELLRRGNNEIYYYSETKECDFIIKEGVKVTKAIQVCYELTSENRFREIDGLSHIMSKFKLDEGYIITLKQEEDLHVVGGRVIHVIPVWKLALDLINI